MLPFIYKKNEISIPKNSRTRPEHPCIKDNSSKTKFQKSSYLFLCSHKGCHSRMKVDVCEDD